jgi:hypothetical protein
MPWTTRVTRRGCPSPFQAYQNAMKNSDRQNAHIEHDKALERVSTEQAAN